MTTPAKSKAKVELYLSRDSATYHYVRSQVGRCCELIFGNGNYQVKVIDVLDRPDLAEKNNIEALPTIVCDGKRFIGTPQQERLLGFLGVGTRLTPPDDNRN